MRGFLFPLPCSGPFFPFSVFFPLVFCAVAFLERPDLSEGEGVIGLERIVGTLGMVVWSSWATLYGDTVN